MSTLEHIDDDIGALREMSRILKEEGKLYISVPMESEFYLEEDLEPIINIERLKLVNIKKVPIEENKRVCLMVFERIK